MRSDDEFDDDDMDNIRNLENLVAKADIPASLRRQILADAAMRAMNALREGRNDDGTLSDKTSFNKETPMTAKSEINGREVCWSENLKRWKYVDTGNMVHINAIHVGHQFSVKSCSDDGCDFCKIKPITSSNHEASRTEIHGREVLRNQVRGPWYYVDTYEDVGHNHVWLPESKRFSDCICGDDIINSGCPSCVPKQPSGDEAEAVKINERQVEWNGIGRDGGWRFCDSGDPVTVFTEQDADYLELQMPGSITDPRSIHFRPLELSKYPSSPKAEEAGKEKTFDAFGGLQKALEELDMAYQKQINKSPLQRIIADVPHGIIVTLTIDKRGECEECNVD